MSGRELLEAYENYLEDPWGETRADIRAGLMSWVLSVPWSGESGPPPIEPYLNMFCFTADPTAEPEDREMSAEELCMLIQQRNRERKALENGTAD